MVMEKTVGDNTHVQFRLSLSYTEIRSVHEGHRSKHIDQFSFARTSTTRRSRRELKEGWLENGRKERTRERKRERERSGQEQRGEESQGKREERRKEQEGAGSDEEPYDMFTNNLIVLPMSRNVHARKHTTARAFRSTVTERRCCDILELVPSAPRLLATCHEDMFTRDHHPLMTR